MPGTNSFYPYGESSTNILNNSEYQTDSERSSGAQSGAIARSKMYNKQARQAAAGAYAVGALVAKSGKNADDSSAATLAANFQAAVNYQAAHFVASAVSVSGTTATATVAELATTAAADLPALFALSLVLDQALPAGASIAITSSLPDVTLSWPIYVGSEVLDSDTITGGAITLLIDTVGAKAFFKAGGMGKLPSDLAPLCPNFTVERTGGKVKISADKIQLNSYTNMVSGGVWAWGKTLPAKPTGENTKQWSRAELITTGGTYDLVPDDPALSGKQARVPDIPEAPPEGTPVQLKDIPVSTAGSAVTLKIPESETSQREYLYLDNNYKNLGSCLALRKECLPNPTNPGSYIYGSSSMNSSITTWKESLPSVVKKYLAPISITYKTDTTSSSTGQLTESAFLPSAANMNLAVSWHGDTKYPYFDTDVSRVAKIQDTQTNVLYYTRDINTKNTESYWWYAGINTNGRMENAAYNGSAYLRPMLSISPDTWFIDNGDGTYTFVGDEPTADLSIEIDWPESDPLIARQWVYNEKGVYQTMLLGGVASTEDAPAYSPVLSENTWEQIAQACADHDPILDSWLVGDEKDEVINGETLTFVIVGKDHDDKSDGTGKAKLTFGMTQLMSNTRQMNGSNTNVGSFAGSALYAHLRDTILPGMPEELRAAIKPVNKPTSSGSQNSTIRNDSMSLWLFSEVEIFGRTTYSFGGEGFQYPYFATAANKIKRLFNGAGEVSIWWERSPNSDYSGGFCCVNASGAAGFNGASLSCGVCFGFCV